MLVDNEVLTRTSMKARACVISDDNHSVRFVCEKDILSKATFKNYHCTLECIIIFTSKISDISELRSSMDNLLRVTTTSFLQAD